MKLSEFVKAEYGKSISECTNEELYYALLTLTKKMASGKQHGNSKKKLYYISAEFLIGKLLSNNLINLGIYDEVKEELAQNGKDICEIEEFENEPSLGNGGLGRLAACFIDSIATLGLNGDGVGLNYHFGLFRQIFENNMQTTVPDPWLTEKSWLTKTDVTYDIKFKGMTVKSRMYDIDVIGYNNTSNKLHLFDVESVDESIVEDGINFNKEDIKKNLTLFLYPDDSDEAGRILRIYQQYFMVSSAAQLILDECVAKGCNLHDLSDYVVIQINDTHPTMVIPELIRLLVERGLEMDEAIEVVTKSCAYTNHTILAEALEKWPIYYLKKAVPQLMPIIEVLDDKVRRKYHNQEVYIIDGEERVHMAHIDIHYSSSVNGVASLHTEILKNNELHHFYEIYPEKFNNKTNGITFRRWLLHCNPQLTELITSLIGDGFKKDATQLEKLLDYKNDEKVLKQLLEIKSAKKMELKKALMEKQNVTINENSIFDIQIKRLNNDPEVSPYLNVVMVENYNVTWAEKLIPACDISEQISLASKEASGTGNMKFMLNGALTLGTEDGANVEIHERVGDDNIYIFGDSSDTVVERYAQGSYHAAKYYNENAAIKEAVDFITGEELKAIGDKDRLERLFNELVSKDWFMTFPDFDEYVKTREQAYADYENREEWVQKMLVNIAKAGYFSSDRTIEEYNRDIWKLED